MPDKQSSWPTPEPWEIEIEEKPDGATIEIVPTGFRTSASGPEAVAQAKANAAIMAAAPRLYRAAYIALSMGERMHANLQGMGCDENWLRTQVERILVAANDALAVYHAHRGTPTNPWREKADETSARLLRQTEARSYLPDRDASDLSDDSDGQ